MKTENFNRLALQLKRQEGIKRTLYKCPAGYQTIGVGRNVETKGLSQAEFESIFGCRDRMGRSDVDWLTDIRLSDDAIDMMLNNDIREFAAKVNDVVDIQKCGEVRFCALVNMAFNLGFMGMLAFKNMLRSFNAGHYTEAADHALDSRWAKQVGARSMEIATIIEEGKWL